MPGTEAVESRQRQSNCNCFLEELGRKGISLWAEAGQLRYRAPKGALTFADLEALKLEKERIVALLEARAGDRPAQGRQDSEFARAPLAYSQLAHWNLYRLAERPAIRQIAAALRMRGQLDLSALRLSIAAVTRRHDALRTRIVVVDGVPVQQVGAGTEAELPVDDLSALPSSLQAEEIARRIEQQILEPVDVARDPLFAARLLALGPEEHILILALEHMISDLYSLKLLIRDLLGAYFQAIDALPVTLPPIPLQFHEYASRQRSAQDSWVGQHGAYWSERLARWRRLRFPADGPGMHVAGDGCSHVSVRIDSGTKGRLLEWSRRRRTTLVMSVLTAYTALVLHWCHVREAVVQCQSDGRSDPSVENTVGYFASALYLRIGLSQDDTWLDLLEQVMREYCTAYERADFSYMAAQIPRPDFTLSTQFNWVPHGADLEPNVSRAARSPLDCSLVPFVHPLVKRVGLDIEPSILLFDSEDGIVGDLYFPPHRHTGPAMNRFAHNLQIMIAALLDEPARRVLDIELA